MILGNTELYRSCTSSSKNTSKSDNVIVVNNESFFIDALDMIRESNRYLNASLKSAYKDVLLTEGENEKRRVYIEEAGFSGLIDKVIKFFTTTITQLWNKFKTMVLKFVYADSTVFKYEDKIKNMDGEFNVTFERYLYSVQDSYIPMVDLKAEFYNQLDRLENKLNELSGLKTPEERISKMAILEEEIGVSDSYYSSLRQRVLKTGYMISSENYANELFNAFRSGGMLHTTKVDVTEVTIIFDRFKDHKKLLKETEKAKNRTIRSADEVKDKIKHIQLRDKNKYYIPYTEKEEYMFNRILNKQIQQINEACSIFTMAYSAKLDAIKESAKQDKRVLYEAIQYINMQG